MSDRNESHAVGRNLPEFSFFLSELRRTADAAPGQAGRMAFWRVLRQHISHSRLHRA